MKAYELLEQNDLCKGWYAKDKEGNDVQPLNPNACAFCTMGALQRAYENWYIRQQAINRLENKIHRIAGDFSIARWNDKPERTKEEVVSLLKELDI